MGSTNRAGARTIPTADDAPFGRRILAFVIDWAVALVVTFQVLPFDFAEPGEEPPTFLGIPVTSWVALGVFVALRTLTVSVVGSSLGHRLLGLQVWQVRRGFFPGQVLLRTLLASVFVPAIVRVGDGRLLHDVAAGTRIVHPAAAPTDHTG
ncbi:MAG: RDD family protein [Dermatophilaceae bacterium]